MKPSIPLHRNLSMGTLILLLACCVFFTFYDILHENIWWSTLYIYLPSIALFSFGLYSWWKQAAGSLRIFGFVLVILDAFLLGYGIWLLIGGSFLWGGLTLGFASISIALTWSALKASRWLKGADLQV